MGFLKRRKSSGYDDSYASTSSMEPNPKKFSRKIDFTYAVVKREWGLVAHEIRSLIVLGSVIGSYLILTYLLFFDLRLESNVPILIPFHLFDLIFLFDTIDMIRNIESNMKLHAYNHQAHDYETPVKEAIRKAKFIIPLIMDCISVLPIEIFILAYTDGENPEHFKGLEDAVVDEHSAVVKALKLFALLRLNRVLRLHRIYSFYSKHIKLPMAY